MKGLDTNLIINKHKDSPSLYPVIGGGNVIGQEIDADNRLVYVVKKGNVITLEHAENYPIIPVVHPTKGHQTKITIP